MSPRVHSGIRTRRRRTLLVAGLLASLVLALSASGAAYAQESLVLQSVDDEDYPLISLTVLLPEELMPSAEAAPVFEVQENGTTIAEVDARPAAEARGPVDVVLLVDTSGSMQGEPLEYAKDAASEFVESMGADDRIAVVSFSDEPSVVLELTKDRDAAVRAIGSLSASGETALYDGLARATQVASASDADQRYVVVLSDGGDTVSISTLDAAASALADTGVPLYAVALESPEYDPEPLRLLADDSDGRIVSATSASELTSIYQEIARELQNVFLVDYTSNVPNTPDIEIGLTVTKGVSSGSAVTVVDNPAFEVVTGAVGSSAATASTPDLLLSVGLVFLAVVLVAAAVGAIVFRERANLEQLDYYGGGGSAHTAASKRTGPDGPVMGVVAQIAERRGYTAELRLRLERAGLPLRPNEYIYFHLLGTVLLGVVTALLSGSLALTLLVVVAAVVMPLVTLRVLADRRSRTFDEQLPEILTLVAGSLRAGWGVQQALGLVAQEIGEPAASEFRRVQSESSFGLTLEDALTRMAERMDSDDFRWTATAISIQREVGGDLAEVLDVVAATIRERAELKRHVRALTAEGRFSAVVLVILPFFALGAMSLVAPQWVGLLFDSSFGVGMLVVGGIMLLIGGVWLYKLTKVEI